MDIFGGLKNALEKGEDLEKAVRSFITAGYPETEVRQAAQALSTGAPIKPHSNTNPKQSKTAWPVQKKQGIQQTQQFQQPTIQGQNQNQTFQQPMQKPKRKIDWKLIILGSGLFILIIILLASVLFKDQITSFFSGIL